MLSKIKTITVLTLLLCLGQASFAFNPEGTLEVISQGPHSQGPNCWNGALVSAGVLPYHRFITDLEFKYLIERKCRPNLGEVQKGDLGRIWIPATNFEIHGYIFLDAETIYAKHSDRASENYVVMSFDEMWAHYSTTRDCKLKNSPGRECESQVEYYTCDQENPVLDALREELKSVEALVHELIFSSETKWSFGEKCDSSSFKKREEILPLITQELATIKDRAPIEMEYLNLWANSIQTQIYYSEVSSRNYNCRKQLSSEEKNKKYKEVRLAIKNLLSNNLGTTNPHH